MMYSHQLNDSKVSQSLHDAHGLRLKAPHVCMNSHNSLYFRFETGSLMQTMPSHELLVSNRQSKPQDETQERRAPCQFKKYRTCHKACKCLMHSLKQLSLNRRARVDFLAAT